ncbi:MAG: winged helix-turn-helix domain-containing protein [Actinomycetota bacterium]|nr:winged helix-turn-helix domain-containing protein [Actinomycetota bacterium]
MDFRLLGALEVLRDGAPLSLPAGRARVVLAALLTSPGQPVSVERLIDALWEDEPPTTAANVVQVYVSRLRKALGADRVRNGPGGYLLAATGDELDSARFLRLAASGRAQLAAGNPAPAAEILATALALWRGPALADVLGYRFAGIEASRLEAARMAALRARIEADLALGRHAQLVGELADLVSRHPLDEDLRGLAMLALYRAGRQADALRMYAEGKDLLVEELGIDPGPALQTLHGRLLRQDQDLAGPAVPLPVSVPVPVPPTKPIAGTGSVPRPSTVLIGRDREVAEVAALLGRPDVRLVNLLGPGGVGKSRLSWAVAEALVDTFPEGIYAVALDAVRTRQDATSALARVLGAYRAGAGTDLQDLVAALQGRRVLVLLDNVEQIADLSVDVAELLGALPDLHLLTTSRTTLRRSASRDYLVSPLPRPAVSDPLDQLLINPAIQLFADRAGAVDATFAVTPDIARDVAGICARLDGLPLAIELAAARIRMLSPGDLLSRLDRQLPLLTGGNDELPDRQRTLRVTIDWSYSLLTDVEASVFAQLAVFAGGCTLAAAERVCFVGEPTEAADDDVLEVVAGLLDKSLLVREPRDGTARFRMLETVREYAGERLAASGVEAQVRSRHAAYFLELTETAVLQRHADVDPGALRRFDLEIDNLLAALSWSFDQDSTELLGRLAAGLADYWYLAGRIRQCESWTKRALTRPLPTYERGILLHTAGNATMSNPNGLADALEYYTAGRAVFDELGDRGRSARSCYGMAKAALWQGDLVLAEAAVRDGITLAQLGGTSVLEPLLVLLGEVTLAAGDIAGAVALWRQALASATRTSNGVTEALANLGLGALALGELTEAAELAEQALERARSSGSLLEMSDVLISCGLTALEQGRVDLAREQFAESLATRLGCGLFTHAAESLSGLAATAVAAGDMTRAAGLRSAAHRLLAGTGSVLAPPSVLFFYGKYYDRLNAALDPSELAAAGARGATMSWAEAAEYALALPSPAA